MKEMNLLCSLIVQMTEEYSESFFENGTLTICFDCHDYHYEVTVDRTIKEEGAEK